MEVKEENLIEKVAPVGKIFRIVFLRNIQEKDEQICAFKQRYQYSVDRAVYVFDFGKKAIEVFQKDIKHIDIVDYEPGKKKKRLF